MQITFEKQKIKLRTCKRKHYRNLLVTESWFRMSFLLILAVFLTFVIDITSAIQCYKCSVVVELNNSQIVTHLCANFDESEKYIVDCPFSTMCLKTISTLHLQNNQKRETITRGCAQQKDTTQVFRNKEWHKQHSVQEVYEEGCTELTENNLVASLNTHCYCRGDLCNSTPPTATTSLSLISMLTVIILFNVYLPFFS